jgi:hypothetical protein
LRAHHNGHTLDAFAPSCALQRGKLLHLTHQQQRHLKGGVVKQAVSAT